MLDYNRFTDEPAPHFIEHYDGARRTITVSHFPLRFLLSTALLRSKMRPKIIVRSFRALSFYCANASAKYRIVGRVDPQTWALERIDP